MPLSKEQILRQNGYKYYFKRMMYFNPETKKIFSYEAIDNNDEIWLEKKVHTKKTKNWEFYFSNPKTISEMTKKDIIHELDRR